MGVVDFLKKIGLLKNSSGSWSGNVQDQKASDVLGDYSSSKEKAVECIDDNGCGGSDSDGGGSDGGGE